MDRATVSTAAAEEGLSEQSGERPGTPGGAGQTSAAVADAPASSPLQLQAPVKLVIWDLDEVLWQGVLSEGEVELDPACAEVVRTLNRRGIVNSICSKNDPDDARARLEREGVWEEFVFASIAWTPKGPRIAQIVEDMQLRPVNVLFIDDNVTNLGEARHYVPGLQVAEPSAIAELLSLPQCVGKDDSALTRLAQYRVLETKSADRAQSAVSNEDFLRSCDIRVQLRDAAEEDPARLLELVNRSNQLNFTKSRISEDELAEMLAQEGRETRAVQVSDRYGAYGVAGFYSVRDGRLDHFVFSCRILHMGVEQWIYARLGKPEIKIAGEVASSLQHSESVDWVTLGEAPAAAAPAAARARLSPASSSRVLLKGGCDLWMMNPFLGGSIKTEFTYPSPTGAEVHGDNAEILRRSSPDTLREFGEVIDRLPFLDRAAYRSRLARAPKSIGTMIYSVLMDYAQGIYRLRDSDFAIPYEQFDIDATDQSNWPHLQERWGDVGIDRPFLEWFAERFQFEGPQSQERFKDNIRWMAGRLSEVGARLIVLNGAEVPLRHRLGWEPDRHLHHIRMNQALEELVAELPNAAICDVRPFVTSREDLTDNLRHYTRQAYIRIAEHLAELVGSDLAVERRPLVSRLHRARRKVARKVDHAAQRYRLR